LLEIEIENLTFISRQATQRYDSVMDLITDLTDEVAELTVQIKCLRSEVESQEDTKYGLQISFTKSRLIEKMAELD